MSLVQRLLNFDFQLDATGSTLSLSGVRASAVITQLAANSTVICGYSAEVRIWGLSLDHMNQLSAVNPVLLATRNNIVTISAGDSVNGMTPIFNGILFESWAQLNGAPNIYLQFSANAMPFKASLNNIQPTSFPGPVSVASVMELLAKSAGLAFVNSGVTTQLGSLYLPGLVREQIRSLKEQANINLTITNNVLTIWPRNGSISPPGATPNLVISAENGMVGYPVHSGQGIMVNTLFNPDLQVGMPVTVKSMIKPACGDYVIQFPIIHKLDSMVPDGQWFTQLTLASVNSDH